MGKVARTQAAALIALLAAAGTAAAEEPRDPAQAGAAFRELMAAVARRATGMPEVPPCAAPSAHGGCLDGSRPPAMAWNGDGPPPPGTALDVPTRGVYAAVARETQGSWMGPGDECLLGKGDAVEVLGTDPAFGSLVRISVPARAARPQAVDCADGTLAFLPAAKLSTWPARGEVAARRKVLAGRLAAAVDGIIPPEGR